jgi:hypothetical protein
MSTETLMAEAYVFAAAYAAERAILYPHTSGSAAARVNAIEATKKFRENFCPTVQGGPSAETT